MSQLKLIYVDEAGTLKNEPYFVACGVITDPDECYLSVRRYYFDLSNDLFPEWEGFGNSAIFHAKDIWHGVGHWDRGKWSKQDRMKILRRLVQVPVLFQLPICFGILEKADAAKSVETTPATTAKQRERLLSRIIYSQGFLGMLQVADWWMTKNCPSISSASGCLHLRQALTPEWLVGQTSGGIIALYNYNPIGL